MSNIQSNNNDQTLEISLIDLINFIKKYFLILIFAALASGIIGIIYSFTLPRKYTAQTILLPEYSMGGGNSFFSMAVGNDKGGAEKLTPDLYPNILNSAPFGKYLLTIPVADENNVQYQTLKQYLLRDSTISLYNRFFSAPKESTAPKKVVASPQLSNIMILSGEESGLVRTATSLIAATVDGKNGIITLECELTDPYVAAILVESSKNYLINYVEDYRTSKTSEQVSFLEKQVIEAKRRQRDAEYALQSYRDHNRNAFLNVARIEEQRLQAEYTLSQSIYTDLTVKLEQAKIKVKEEKPVFKVLEPSRVPLDKSSPKRSIIGVIFALFGGLFTLIYIVFFKEKLHLKLL
jgi:uncharacterized protein involved in exopolysaccharide biosynthesis